MFLQYYRFGFWKVKVIRKHGKPASWRHLVPAAFVAAVVAIGMAGLFFPALRWLLAAVLVPYGCFLPVLPVVFATFHFGYGMGFLAGLVR